jgi:hypothetical protein
MDERVALLNNDPAAAAATATTTTGRSWLPGWWRGLHSSSTFLDSCVVAGAHRDGDDEQPVVSRGRDTTRRFLALALVSLVLVAAGFVALGGGRGGVGGGLVALGGGRGGVDGGGGLGEGEGIVERGGGGGGTPSSSRLGVGGYYAAAANAAAAAAGANAAPATPAVAATPAAAAAASDVPVDEIAIGQGNAGDPFRWRAMPAFGSAEHDCPQGFGTPLFLPVDQLPAFTRAYAAVLAMAGRVYVMCMFEKCQKVMLPDTLRGRAFTVGLYKLSAVDPHCLHYLQCVHCLHCLRIARKAPGFKPLNFTRDFPVSSLCFQPFQVGQLAPLRLGERRGVEAAGSAQRRGRAQLRARPRGVRGRPRWGCARSRSS